MGAHALPAGRDVVCLRLSTSLETRGSYSFYAQYWLVLCQLSLVEETYRRIGVLRIHEDCDPGSEEMPVRLGRIDRHADTRTLQIT